MCIGTLVEGGCETQSVRYELLIMAPMGPLRERKLLLEDRPLRIQAWLLRAHGTWKEKAGCTAYKFVFREIMRASQGPSAWWVTCSGRQEVQLMRVSRILEPGKGPKGT